MKEQFDLISDQRGFTLIEMIVTLGVLSIFFIGTLGFYSTAYRDLWMQEASMNVLHDANLVMSHIGDDLRHASEFLKDYKHNELQMVVAAMKVLKGPSSQPEENIIIYALDQKRPNRLIRSVYKGGKLTSLELSKYIQSLEITQIAERLLEVKLVVTDKIAGRTITRQFSSAYSMRK